MKAMKVKKHYDYAILGIAFAFISYIFVSLMGMSMKWVSGKYSLIEILFFRSVVGVVFSMIFLYATEKRLSIQTFRPHLHIFRFLLMSFALGISLIGIQYVPFAEFTVLNFAFSLFVFLLSVFFLKQKVGIFRLCIIITGLFGVIIVMQPGTEAFSIGSIIIIFSVFLMACNQLITKHMLYYDRSVDIIYFFSLIGTILYSLIVPFFWITPSFVDLLFLILLGFSSFMVQYTMNWALTFAPAHVVSPVEYTVLIWNVIIGYVIWHETPGSELWYGATLIIISGILLIYREYYLEKKKHESNKHL